MEREGYGSFVTFLLRHGGFLFSQIMSRALVSGFGRAVCDWFIGTGPIGIHSLSGQSYGCDWRSLLFAWSFL